MTTSFCDCQVLVVGAGPAGLLLAAQLLDTMGLADAFIEHGQHVRRFRMYAGRRSLLNPDMTRNGSRYGFIADAAAVEYPVEREGENDRNPRLREHIQKRQLEKPVTWTGRERLRCLWYRLRLTIQEMNYATRRLAEL